MCRGVGRCGGRLPRGLSRPVSGRPSHQATGWSQQIQTQVVRSSITASRAGPRKSRDRRPSSMMAPLLSYTARRMWPMSAALMASSGCRRRPDWVRETTLRNRRGSEVAPVVWALCALFEQGSGIAIALRSERIADIDHVGHIGGGGVDHPAELFDTFDQFGRHVRFRSRRIERAELVDCGYGRDDRSSDRVVVSVTVSDRFVGVDGAEPCKRWHRTRERSHRRPPRIEVLDSGQRCRRIRRIRRALVRR